MYAIPKSKSVPKVDANIYQILQNKGKNYSKHTLNGTISPARLEGMLSEALLHRRLAFSHGRARHRHQFSQNVDPESQNEYNSHHIYDNSTSDYHSTLPTLHAKYVGPSNKNKILSKFSNAKLRFLIHSIRCGNSNPQRNKCTVLIHNHSFEFPQTKMVIYSKK